MTPPLREDRRDPATGLRALLLNYEYPPLGGGAGVATAALAECLARRGAVVDVVTAGTTGRLQRVIARPGLAVIRVPTRRTGVHQASMADAAWYLASALPVVRRLVRRRTYDVVHCYFSLPTGVLLPLGGLGALPSVVSLRGSDVPGYDGTVRTLQRMHRVLRPLTRHIWRRAGHVVALSESLGRLAHETDPGLRYSVIRNGVDVERFRPPVQPRPLRLDRVHCLAVARLVERKGIADLLHAFARLERGRFTLEIVGEGKDGPAFRALAAELGLAEAVTFTGALDHEQVAERYRAADLFTLASWDESFGNVFAEALASGLPIVGSLVGGIPEFVTPGRNGFLVEPRRPDLLAAAIRSLADKPLLRAEMAARNRHKAETVLSWDAVADRYLAVYGALHQQRVSGGVPSPLLPLAAHGAGGAGGAGGAAEALEA